MRGEPDGIDRAGSVREGAALPTCIEHEAARTCPRHRNLERRTSCSRARIGGTIRSLRPFATTFAVGGLRRGTRVSASPGSFVFYAGAKAGFSAKSPAAGPLPQPAGESEAAGSATGYVAPQATPATPASTEGPLPVGRCRRTEGNQSASWGILPAFSSISQSWTAASCGETFDASIARSGFSGGS